MDCFVGHDLGTGGNKAVLCDLQGEVLAAHVSAYPVSYPRPGWVEQDPEHWWRAVCEGTRAVTAGIDPARIKALTFAGQMLALVPLGRDAKPTRPALSWLDHRGDDEARRINRRMGGERIVRMLAAGAPTGKDLVAKIAWIRRHEPKVHAATAAYGDATSALVARATGRLAIDPCAAGGTGILSLSTRRWSPLLARLIDFPLEKMPEILPSAAIAGPLLPLSARELGLPEALPVAMGTADIPAAAVGSGAVEPGDAHLYLGTSSWIGLTLRRALHLPRHGIASVPSAAPDGALLIAESETAGACRDWFEAQIGPLDDAAAAATPPGADGLLFLPWLFGERAPVSNSALRGGFVGLSLQHTRAHMARALLEGVALNLAWILQAIRKKTRPNPGLRAIGGGARSDLWLQIIADATGEAVTRIAEPRLAGALGAALLGAVATGALPDLTAIKARIHTEATFEPRPEHAPTYAAGLAAFQSLAPALSRLARR